MRHRRAARLGWATTPLILLGLVVQAAGVAGLSLAGPLPVPPLPAWTPLAVPALVYVVSGVAAVRRFAIAPFAGALVTAGALHAVLVVLPVALAPWVASYAGDRSVAPPPVTSPALAALTVLSVLITLAPLRPLVAPRPRYARVAPRAGYPSAPRPVRAAAELPFAPAGRGASPGAVAPPAPPRTAAAAAAVKPLRAVTTPVASAPATGGAPPAASPPPMPPIAPRGHVPAPPRAGTPAPPAAAPPAAVAPASPRRAEPPSAPAAATRRPPGAEPMEETIRIAFAQVADQFPSDLFKLPTDRLGANLLEAGFLLVPRSVVWPQLAEGFVQVPWHVVADQFPRQALAVPASEVAGRIANGLIVLPLDEVVRQMPAELFALSTPEVDVRGIEDFPPPFQPHVPPPSASHGEPRGQDAATATSEPAPAVTEPSPGDGPADAELVEPSVVELDESPVVELDESPAVELDEPLAVELDEPPMVELIEPPAVQLDESPVVELVESPAEELDEPPVVELVEPSIEAADVASMEALSIDGPTAEAAPLEPVTIELVTYDEPAPEPDAPVVASTWSDDTPDVPADEGDEGLAAVEPARRTPSRPDESPDDSRGARRPVDHVAPVPPASPAPAPAGQVPPVLPAADDRVRVHVRRIAALLAPLMTPLETGAVAHAGHTMLTVLPPSMDEVAALGAAQPFLPFLTDARLPSPPVQVTLRTAAGALVLTPLAPGDPDGSVLLTATPAGASLALLERLSLRAAHGWQAEHGAARLAQPGALASPDAELRPAEVPPQVQTMAASLQAFGAVVPSVLRGTGEALLVYLFLPRGVDAVALGAVARDLTRALKPGPLGPVESITLRAESERRLVVRTLATAPPTVLVAGGGPVNRPGLAWIELDRAAARLGAVGA